MSLTFFDGFTCFGAQPNQHGAQRWRLDQLTDEMRYCSIAAALVSSKAQFHYDSMLENRRLIDTLAEHEQHDRLFPLWNALPHWTGECPEPTELLTLMHDHGVRAITLHPGYQGWPLLSDTSAPLLRELERTSTPVVLDGREVDDATAEGLLQRYPALPVLMRGIFWRRQRGVLPMMLHHKNLHVGFDFFQINRGLEWLCEHGCEDQLVFCSNAPEMSMGAHRSYIDWADLPEPTKRKIASGNLVRLLGEPALPAEAENPDRDELMAQAQRGEPLSCLVLDCHSHVNDEGLVGCGRMPQFEGGPSGLVEMAGRMGVDGIGVMSWNGAVEAQIPAGNLCVRDALDAMPETCWGLATFDPMHDTPEEQRHQMEAVFADTRFLGLKADPIFGIDYDHPNFTAWWEFGHEHGLYTLLHPNHGRVDLSEFDVLCPRYPGLTFVAAHCAANFARADAAIKMANKHPNFVAELTYTACLGGIIDYLVQGMGPDRVLYGTDQPMRDPRQQLGLFLYSRLPVEQKKMLIGGNGRAMIDRVRHNRGLPALPLTAGASH